MRLGRDVLQDIVGRRVTAYRAPSFSITRHSLWAREILVEEGFQVDSSVFPIHHDRYGIPDAPLEIHRIDTASGPLWEFPPSVVCLAGLRLPVGGGGYFRLYPLRWTTGLLRRIHRRERRAFLIYVHPWEVDPGQPRIAATFAAFAIPALCQFVEHGSEACRFVPAIPLRSNGRGRRPDPKERTFSGGVRNSGKRGTRRVREERVMASSAASTLPPEVAASTPASPLFVSVVVPVRNEAPCIERTLQCLLAQDYDPGRFEVLVIDGESNDGTPEIVARMARDHANLRLLQNPQRLSSAARNVGIRNARGEVVLVVDGHCEVNDRQHLRRLAAAFQHSGADCIGRPQPLDVAGTSAVQRAIAAARGSRLGHHPDSFIYSSHSRIVPAKSVAVAYRRGVFERVGYFDETFDACEDVELNHRIDLARLKCLFAPEVAVRYVPRNTLRGLFRQMVRYGRGRVRLWRKHPETMTLKTLLPGMFVLGWTAGVVPACLWPWCGAAYISAAGCIPGDSVGRIAGCRRGPA